MANHKFCYIYLTCASSKEASKITAALLQKRLIACVKQLPVTSDFHRGGKIEHGKEVLLIMESRIDLFEEIEGEVAKLHSYDTFVLEAVPVTRVSQRAWEWLEKELSDG